jgi:mannose-6-phosphate isomerase-like protein (cupin superfamily)
MVVGAAVVGGGGGAGFVVTGTGEVVVDVGESVDVGAGATDSAVVVGSLPHAVISRLQTTPVVVSVRNVREVYMGAPSR